MTRGDEIDLTERLHAATEIAHEAGEILLGYFRGDRLDVRSKGQRDLVTAADLASERRIVQRTAALFPADGLLAEEGSVLPTSSGLRWCVDPLDGTLNFETGLPVWCVSIAVFEGDEPVLGVIHDPLRDQTFRAMRGGGAFRDGEPITVSNVNDLSQAFVHLTIDFDDRAQQTGLRDIGLVAPQVLRTRNLGSAALSLAYVAAGWLDAVLHRAAHPWDYGAGVILIREAGGSVTAIDGAPYAMASPSIAAAATDALRAGLVDIIREC